MSGLFGDSPADNIAALLEAVPPTIGEGEYLLTSGILDFEDTLSL
jgi:hypothetical protein